MWCLITTSKLLYHDIHFHQWKQYQFLGSGEIKLNEEACLLTTSRVQYPCEKLETCFLKNETDLIFF